MTSTGQKLSSSTKKPESWKSGGTPKLKFARRGTIIGSTTARPYRSQGHSRPLRPNRSHRPWRRLATAARAHDRYHFAALDRQVHTAKGGHFHLPRVVRLVDAPRLDDQVVCHGTHAGECPSPRHQGACWLWCGE